MLQEDKTHQMFQKTIISYTLIRISSCAHQGERNISFLKNVYERTKWTTPYWFFTCSAILSNNFVRFIVLRLIESRNQSVFISNEKLLTILIRKTCLAKIALFSLYMNFNSFQVNIPLTCLWFSDISGDAEKTH